MKLEKIKTCDLVKELEKREGVESFSVPVDEEIEIKINGKENLDFYDENNESTGPAIMLKVID